MEKIIKVGGFDTFYREEGSGKNLLLLHGWGGNNKSFTPVFNSLKNYFHVYCPDLWGFGDSAAPSAGADTYWYADMVMEFAARVGAREAHIIGHSFGGRIAVLLAAEYPEFVGKLVLCDAAGIRPKFSPAKRLAVARYRRLKRKVAAGRADASALAEWGSGDYRAADGVMRGVFVRVVNDFLEKEARKIKAETLIVWGKKDDATPLYMAKKYNKLIHGSGLVIVKDAGHFSYLDDFYLFDKTVRSFFGVL